MTALNNIVSGITDAKCATGGGATELAKVLSASGLSRLFAQAHAMIIFFRTGLNSIHLIFPALLLFAGALLFAAEEKAPGEAAAWAAEHIAAGKYQEAENLLKKRLPLCPEGSPEWRQTALTLIEAERIVGEQPEAKELCAALLKADPKNYTAQLLEAELDFETGEYPKALEAYNRIIAAQPENERAWALRTFVLRTLSDRDLLKKTAEHFYELYQNKLDYFNSDAVKDPLELAYIALGFQDEDPKTAFEIGYQMAEELTAKRGLQLPEIFLWSARLAREKYAFGLARERYEALLKMRPHYPDALAGVASIILQTDHRLDEAEKLLAEALAVNPRHSEANLLHAMMDFEEDRYDSAKKHLDAALAANSNNFAALALLALYYLDLAQPEKAAAIDARALALNPHCGDYFCFIGEAMENKRIFNNAAAYYQKAIEIEPENWRGYYGLGMNTSRQGAQGEAPGKELLLKAFAKNKFNLWALNMIKMLDKLDGDKEQGVAPVYLESKTEHFTLKFFHKEAAVVRPYLEEWAEKAYERQTQMFGFKPEGPLTIELCYSLQDQGARTVGLPVFGLLGVCFGKLCTVVSPREGRNNTPPFNWRKVLEHEFGHVMVLQMSGFRVPRWYTEAFSTWLEESGRLAADPILKEALAHDRLKPLEKMNEYFRENMLMAYVHGRYAIEYIDKTFGFAAHLKAIQLFAEGKKTEEALPAATGRSLEELNAGTLDYLKKFLANIHLRLPPSQPELLLLELAAKPENAPAQACSDYALALLTLHNFDAAEAQAKRALEKDPKCVDALNVLGVLAHNKNNLAAAKQFFLTSTALDPKHSFEAWRRLGIIHKEEGQIENAIAAFENARAMYPRYTSPDGPYYELPELYLELNPPQPGKALAIWRAAVKINPEDAEAAWRGLKLAMAEKDFQAAAEFAGAHIEIDPYKAEVHRLAGQAYENLHDLPKAVREFVVATAVDDKDAASWTALARVDKALGDNAAALRAAQFALEIDSQNEEATKIVQELKDK
jgi:tetratricopeptide (TPR) repeat protein